MLKIKEYVKAESLEQAYELNQKKTNCVIGGMLWLKMVTRNVQKAIDLSGLGLDQIEENDEEFSIGAMVTLRPVSYTHLDVYKRQVYNYVVKNVKYDDEKAQNVQSGYLPSVDETLKTKKGICFDYAAPVSYTHLDVYKRQLLYKTKMGRPR